MKLNKYILIGTIAVAGLSSCVSETIGVEDNGNENNQQDGTGRMALDVSLLEPQATRAESQVTNYPVIIYGEDGEVVTRYEAVSMVPESVPLAVGNYVVESHTPGVLERKMDAPYYLGTFDLEILANTTTDATVVCRMQNSGITVKYDQKFYDAFKTWTITLTDDNEMALVFDQNDPVKPVPVYWWFKEEERVEKLMVQFRAVTEGTGDAVAYNTVISKADPTSTDKKYDDDRLYFTGGDNIVLNFTAVEDDKGQIAGVQVTVTATFFDENEEIVEDLFVTDKGLNQDGGEEDPGQSGGGEEEPTPTPGEGEITLDLPQPIEIPLYDADGVDPRLGDTYIAAGEGLKSIVVKIESTSQDMLDSVEELAENYDGVDFLSGTEIIGNQELVRLFSELGQELEVPNQGDKDYTFPIGNFFTLLSVLDGEHTFTLTVVDMTGNSKSGKVVVTVQ